MEEVYSIKSGPKITGKVGSWNYGAYNSSSNNKSSSSVSKVSFRESTHERRGDLRGISLVAAVRESNFAVRYSKVNGSYPEEGPRGFFIEVALALAAKLNFSLEWTPPPDGQWGSEREDGTWTGMVGMLAEGRADVCTTELTVTLGRSKEGKICYLTSRKVSFVDVAAVVATIVALTVAAELGCLVVDNWRKKFDFDLKNNVI